jgi:hypothetical protein
MDSYIDYKYSDKIDNYNFLLNLIYFLHIDFNFYISLIYVLSYPFIFSSDNIIISVYSFFYCNNLLNFMNNNYKKRLYHDIGFMFIYYMNNQFFNIFITSLYYILIFSYTILIISSICMYYYINRTVLDYIKYYINTRNYINGPCVKYVYNNKPVNININSLYDNLSDIFKDSLNMG